VSLKEKAASIWAKLVKQYRMVLYDHESLSQSRHVIFKPLSAILIAGGSLLGMAAITSLLIFTVPGIRNNMPGTSAQLDEDYKSLQAKNMDLELKVIALDSMLSVLKNAMGDGSKPLPNRQMYESATPESATPQAGNQANTPESQPIPNDPPAHVEPVQVGEAAAPAPKTRKGPVILNLVPPIDGYVTKDFEPKDKPHFGIDLAAEENSLVRAVADGVVIFSEYSSTTGYVVGIWHSQSNLLSFYKHNSRIYKTVGSYVFAGEAIAVIGNTGINSSGTHLHFELWYDNNPVNPADYINFN
jgi:murein DD-endopeptidase MepM/ murein hydrolase activator NlpD